ncbi:hypothetical protein ACFVOR_36960 [Streptomyces sp. NPDC057837]|uniref:hypothetical protein n=1 Tax=Streptomyces sp. NPDC057837 TaxID=3346260 RepID=UPI0036A0C5C5
MTERTALHGPTRAMHALGQAFQFGQSVEQPGIITATHTATWHMAGLIEQLQSLRDDRVKQLRDGKQ